MRTNHKIITVNMKILSRIEITLVLLLMQSLTNNVCLAKRRLCGTPLYLHLVRVCTFAYEKTPCFKSKFSVIKNVRS